MLIFSPQSLAFIAAPKTGTTAIEMALKPKADIIFTKRRKHISAQRFHARIAPFLETEFGMRPDRFAVIREPEEQIRSWYRYRARQAKKTVKLARHDLALERTETCAGCGEAKGRDGYLPAGNAGNPSGFVQTH